MCNSQIKDAKAQLPIFVDINKMNSEHPCVICYNNTKYFTK